MTGAAVAVIAVLWLISLMLPVWRANGETLKGYHILFLGWLGVFAGQPQWLGNPLVIATLSLAAWPLHEPLLLWPLAIALIAVFIGTARKRSVMMSSGGDSAPIEQRYAGYYCWMAVVLLSAVLAVYLALRPGS